MFHTVAVHHANVQTTRGEGELRQHDPQSGLILARMIDCLIGKAYLLLPLAFELSFENWNPSEKAGE